MSAAGCFDVKMYGAWLQPDRETVTERASKWFPKPGSIDFTDRYGSSAIMYQNYHRLPNRPHVQHQQPVDVNAAAAVASLLRQASSIVGPAGGGGAILPYFRPQMISPESEKPIGCGAFGVVWAARDPRTGRRIALKKLPNVFQSLISCRRVYRELKMLCSFNHDNVLSALDILLPPDTCLNEIYVATELMQSDLHRIIVSQQPLTTDHVKVFLYQILRGLKYLHSARILHRDIKPGNLLVNSNCLLKICDFGLARVAEPNDDHVLTHEVVTQYYRAPEILMGAQHYTEAVDMWSVGCVLAELLSRHILFQANGPMQQLDLIVDLIGSPDVGDLGAACDAAKRHLLRRPRSQPDIKMLYALSADCDHEVVHLLCQLLVFNPERRITAANALYHPFLEDGRLRYHSCMCRCCARDIEGRTMFCDDLEPCHPQPFTSRFEKELVTVMHVKEKLLSLCVDIQQRHMALQYLDSQTALLNKLAQSYCTQSLELSSSYWD